MVFQKTIHDLALLRFGVIGFCAMINHKTIHSRSADLEGLSLNGFPENHSRFGLFTFWGDWFVRDKKHKTIHSQSAELEGLSLNVFPENHSQIIWFLEHQSMVLCSNPTSDFEWF